MVLIVVFLIVAVLILTASLYVYLITFYSSPKRRPVLDDPMTGPQYEAVMEDIYRCGHVMERYPSEDIWITSYDGCRLHGRYYHLANGAPIEILFHGYRSCAFRDCSGGHLLSRKMGFNALVVDQRAHGESDGKVITFGVKEHRDCGKWVEYAASRFGNEIPVILSGLSMGAATVLMAAGLRLPENVACIIADSPYSAPSAIIEKVCRDLHYPVWLCRPFIHLAALIYGRFMLNSCTAKEAVRHATVPILLIHGEDDRLVPCSMSNEISQSSASPVTVRTFPDAGHGLSYLIDPIGYETTVCDFLMTVPKVKDRISETFLNRKYEN